MRVVIILAMIFCMTVAGIAKVSHARAAFYRELSVDRLLDISELRREVLRLEMANNSQAKILAMAHPGGIKLDWR